ncbi:hypothetical protein ONZ45_g5828 [Pleurotus djamor]|nr:hypothetical protein ONZ45_g5828 [Pleurotus djamor]
MPVFFPDNTNRRDRALQLQNDVVLLQNSVAQAKADMDKQDARMIPLINEILDAHGLASFEELQEKLNTVLTPEQQQAYRDLIEHSADVESSNKVALITIGVIALTSGAVAVGNLIRVGFLLDAMRALAHAFFTLVTKGLEAGIAAFNVLSTTLRWVMGRGQFAEDGVLMAKYLANGTTYLGILSIAGILADGFILAYAYYEEKEQKNELDKAIGELYVTRIIAKVYSKMCDAIKTQDGIMLAYLLNAADDPDAAAAIANTLVTNVKNAWTNITTKTALDELIVFDSTRGSWTASDPSYDDAIARAEDKMKADPPQSGPVAAQLASAKSVKAAAHEVAKALDDVWSPIPVHHLSSALAHLHDRKRIHQYAHAKTLRVL